MTIDSRPRDPRPRDARTCVVDALKALQGQPVRTDLADGLLEPANDMPIADLGLESLDVVEWCMEIETRTGVEVDPADFVGLEMVSEIIAKVSDRLAGAKTPIAADASKAHAETAPLSFSQERMWTFCQDPTAAVKYVGTMRTKLGGPLDVRLLIDCITRLVARHAVLRTAFPLADGKPMQFINAASPVECEVHDLPAGADPVSEATRIVRSLAKEVRENLEKGPLARFAVLRISDSEHWLLRAWHHLLYDAESVLVFMRELAEFYDAACDNRVPDLPEPERYAEFAIAQREAFGRGTASWQAAFDWYKAKFNSPSNFRGPPLRRPAPKPDAPPADAACQTPPFSKEMMSHVDTLRQRSGATTYLICVAAATALMSRDGDNPDLAFGTYVSHRRRAKFQHTIGDFSNFMAIRLNCDPTLSFADWLSAVETEIAATENHSGSPYQDIVDELHARREPAPDIHLTFTSNFGLRRPRPVRGIEFARLAPGSGRAMPWGFDFTIQDVEKGLLFFVRFDATLYDPARVKDFLDRLVRFMDAACQNPQLPLENLQ